jgi:hypothetical protein
MVSIDPRISFDSQVTNELIISPPEVVREQIAKSNKESDVEDNEEQTVVRTAAANALANRAEQNAQQDADTPTVSALCSDKIVCVELNPIVTFYRITDSDHYAEVKLRINSNLSLTVTHDGDESKLGWGAAPQSGNTVIIRQSQ